ncbi:MAG: DUF222 domain-containing protein [Gemmatimonadota bacterium]|nr:DUF222 domain-containing protein [Gemmatimonadota bacterium]
MTKTTTETMTMATTAAASDARIGRMDRIAMLYAEITAATRAFLAALAESDRLEDWAAEGFTSCAEWLTWRLGITRNTANEKVRVARALEALPATAEAMARGELSFSKVRALTRVATPESEAELLTYARAVSAGGLERFVRSWREIDGEDEAARERRLHARRALSVFPDETGMYVVRGRLTPEVGAALMRAIEAASDGLYQEERDREREGEREASDAFEREEEDRREAARRRADAVGLIAERALAAGIGIEQGKDATPDLPLSGSRAERYQVMLHLRADAGAEDRHAAAHLDDGTPVTAVTARQLACDAARVDVTHGSDGAVLGVGRRTRTVPPSIRRALEVRDGGCRFPGCGSRFTDAHHVVHWADGGETNLRNLVLLCRRHHRHVHRGGVTVAIDRDQQVVFFTPDGHAMSDGGQMGAWEAVDPLDAA